MINRYTDGNREDLKRVPPGKFRRVYTVAEMSSRHHEIARLLVMGMSNVDVARTLGTTPQMVTNVRNSPVVQEQIKFLSAKKDAETVRLTERIAKALPRCVEYLTNTIEDSDLSDSLRSKNAFGLMAAGGYGPTKNINVKGTHAILTAKDIQEIRDHAESVGISRGFVVEDVQAEVPSEVIDIPKEVS